MLNLNRPMTGRRRRSLEEGIVDLTLISESIGKALVELLQKGWMCPIYAVSVAVNGSMMGCRYDVKVDDENLSCNVLAEWYEPTGFALPVNIMFTDSQGKAARIVVEGPGHKITILN